MTAFCIGLSCFALAGCAGINIVEGKEAGHKRKKTIIATTFAAYDWTKTVIKGSGNVTVIHPITGNSDIHSYHRTSKDVDVYKAADLIICIGTSSDDWLYSIGIDNDRIIPLMNYVEKLEVPNDNQEDPEYDEHIWLSLNNAKKCVNAIETAIAGMDSINRDLYSKNTLDYVRELNKLNDEYLNTVTNSQNKSLIFADRYPFRYLVNDYNLTCYSAFPGCTADTEVSVDVLEDLGQKLHELNLQNICTIAPNEEVAQIVVESSGLNDVGTVVFESMQSISGKEADDNSYIDIMKQNLDTLQEALLLRQPERTDDMGDPLIIFVGSEGETIYQTKVWEIDEGYYYENYTTNSTAHQSLNWNELYNDSGIAFTKEDLLKIASDRGETTFLYNGNAYKIEKFESESWD